MRYTNANRCRLVLALAYPMSMIPFHLLKLLSITIVYVAFMSHLFLLLASFVTVVHNYVMHCNICIILLTKS
jgi:hypothetical protein